MGLIGIFMFMFYFIFLHQKVLDKLGLSRRDDTLMTIGFMMMSVVSNLLNFFNHLIYIGQIDLGYLVISGLIFLMVYLNYKRL